MLPELWPSGAFDLTLGISHAESLDGPLVTRLSGIARRRQACVHGGSFVEVTADGRFFNTSVLFGADGSLIAAYRKIHLFGFDSGEARALTAGETVVVADTPLGPTGLATCYDLRFPELFRKFVDLGATSVLVASGWPRARLARWRILASARAAEDQFWLVGCNETGHHADHQLGGSSLIADPWGEIIAEASADETILYADLDPELPARVRAQFPVLRDRRL